MGKTISPENMKRLESGYMKRTGVPGALLMEYAAHSVCRALSGYSSFGKVLFIAGPGNNGGDAYAAARIWQQMGGKSEIWELTDENHGDARLNRTLAEECGIHLLPADRCPSADEFDAVVDGIFGTGLSKAISGKALDMILWVNKASLPVVSIDIPSGLDGETGMLMNICVKADCTVTFHRIKDGLLTGQGPDYTGKLILSPILIPESEGNYPGMEYLTYSDAERLVPRRAATSHKGSYGHCVIFAGSEGMAGAAAFCAGACVKAGAGLTTVLCRESILPVLQTLCPEAMCVALHEKDGVITPEAAEIARKTLEKADAACAGCGIGTGEDNVAVLEEFAKCSCPVVFDADGLNLISSHRYILDEINREQMRFFTPHPGEAARMLGCTINSILQSPIKSLKKLCGITDGVVLLKGARTLMANGSQEAVNIYGTPALGKGGSGDVLAGILTAIVARKIFGISSLEEIQLAVLIHSLAGVRCGKQEGENCLTPEMLISSIRYDFDDILDLIR